MPSTCNLRRHECESIANRGISGLGRETGDEDVPGVHGTSLGDGF